MNTNNFSTSVPGKEENLLTIFLNKFLPYWPLFIALAFLALASAWAYLKWATPVYEVTATLIIKDENKGVDESRLTESINAFASKKIVENEIEVIQSRGLMKKVASDLHLYAPVYEESRFKVVSAYQTSPVTIIARYPDKIQGSPKDAERLYLDFDPTQSKVLLGHAQYPLNEWVKTPLGELQFQVNTKKTSEPTGPLFLELIPLKAVTAGLVGQLEVGSANKLSTVVNLEFRDEVPQRGEDVLNQLIHHYNLSAVQDRNQLAANTMTFIEDRMTLLERELDILETQVQKYKSSKGIVDLSEQGRVFLQNVSENDRRLADINLQMAVLDKVENYVTSKGMSTGIVPSTLGISDPVLTQLLQKLNENETQYERLSKTTAANNPILLSLRDEIDKARPSILENIQNQRDNLVASRSNLTSTKGNYNTVLQTIPQKERELLEISRQQAIKNEIYSFLLQKREETALSYAPSTGDSKVVDVAESSYSPVSPKRNVIYLAAIALAFMAGIGLVSGKDLLSSKVLYRSDIEDYTHAPIVGELSNVKQGKNKLFKEPDSPIVIEQFRQLRTSLGLYSRTFSKKKLLVTSSIPGEGKSFVSTNLAYSLANSGKKVVLIDFDMRNPRTSTLFTMLQQPGVTDYLAEAGTPEAYIKPTSFNNLSILPAGTRIGDSTELLLNGKLDSLFEYLSEQFDYIIVDTSPVDLVSDGYLLSEYCDISLLVIRHGHTPKNVVKYLGQSNKQKSLRNMALVFNGVRTRGFVRQGYGYGYNYAHAYAPKAYR
jgi:tyrosine-protein kinase Etk/Wzc